MSSLILFLLITLLSSASSSLSSPSHQLINSTSEFSNYTAISEFRILNRRSLFSCPDTNPSVQISISSNSPLSNEENVTVTVSGVSSPDEDDWVAMVSPSHSECVVDKEIKVELSSYLTSFIDIDVSSFSLYCMSSESSCPWNYLMYLITGDNSSLPLLCHYPVKAQYMSNDPAYLECGNKTCEKYQNGVCVQQTCSGSLKFHVVNIRTDIEFVFFTGGFETPCLIKKSTTLNFANPKAPLYGHLSSIDSTGSSMKLTWVSGDEQPQLVQYGDGKLQTSQVTTFTQDDMCSTMLLSPAKDFGWHDPGYIHSAVMTDLQPSSNYSYKYGNDLIGWSDKIQFRTPPAGGSDELKFLIFGDMGKASLDLSAEHYIQPGSLSVVTAMAEEVASGNVDSVFHIGDISYATGFLVEWDYFLQLITPVASHVSYMTAIGNHERDFADSGSVYTTPDSGGECGVAYETYFPMPTTAKDNPWYSIEQGSVHFTVISTEHKWTENSEQYEWMKKDLASVDRSRTPWVIFTGHRPMYSSVTGFLPSVDPNFVDAVEPLLVENKVDLALWGHVHNYERTCAVYQSNCKAMPAKDNDGVDTYDHTNYTAPVHAVIGMAGFSLDEFPSYVDEWSLSRIAEFGYARVHATKEDIRMEFVNSNTKEVEDRFHITKRQDP